jgi:ABC-type branched-subunit amino acid transport system substrate-binding protein
LALILIAVTGLLITGCAANKADDAQPAQGAVPQSSQPAAPLEDTLAERARTDKAAQSDMLVRDVPLDDSVKVGLLAPMSGPHRAVGIALLQAAQLALFDLSDDRFVLLIGDTGGTPQGARVAARDLMDQGARLLLGPLFAESVRQVGEDTRFRDVTVIGFSNDMSVAAPRRYVMGLAPEAQVERIAGYASRNELLRIATLVPDNDFGRRVVSALQEARLTHAIEIAAVGFYDPDAEDLTPQVKRVADYDRRHQELLKERERLEVEGGQGAEAMLKRLEKLDTLNPPEYDALLLPTGGRPLQTLASLFAFYDVDPVDVRYLGTAQWDDNSLIGEPTLRGGWFPAPPPQLWNTFRERYRNAYGSNPPRIASLGYDATALASVLAQQDERDALGGNEFGGPFGEDQFTNPSGFAGIDGIFRFRPDGRVERVFSILEIGADGFSETDPAPRAFEEAFF